MQRYGRSALAGAIDYVVRGRVTQVVGQTPNASAFL